MRQIHPVSIHEKFVASGTYTSTVNEEQFVSHWTIHELLDGSQIIRCDEQSYTNTILVEALWSSSENGSNIERFDVYIYASDSPIQRVKASYFFTNQLQSRITYDDGSSILDEVLLPKVYLVEPPGLIFKGLVIAQASLHPHIEIPLLTFAFHSFDISTLHILEGTISAQLLESIEHQVGNSPRLVEKYQYRQYEPLVWSNKQIFEGICLIDYQQVIVDWEEHNLRLINYARRPDLKRRTSDINP